MNKYRNIKKQVIDNVQEILDCSEHANKIEIHIDLEVGLVPIVDYKVSNYRLLIDKVGDV